MNRNLLAAAFYLFVAGYAANSLWRFWTPLCNESCPGVLVLAIYLTLLCIVLGAVAFAMLTAIRKFSLRRSVLSFLTLAVAISVAAVAITRSLNA